MWSCFLLTRMARNGSGFCLRRLKLIQIWSQNLACYHKYSIWVNGIRVHSQLAEVQNSIPTKLIIDSEMQIIIQHPLPDNRTQFFCFRIHFCWKAPLSEVQGRIQGGALGARAPPDHQKWGPSTKILQNWGPRMAVLGRSRSGAPPLIKSWIRPWRFPPSPSQREFLDPLLILSNGEGGLRASAGATLSWSATVCSHRLVLLLHGKDENVIVIFFMQVVFSSQ